jgi:hypothetical protein
MCIEYMEIYFGEKVKFFLSILLNFNGILIKFPSVEVKTGRLRVQSLLLILRLIRSCLRDGGSKLVRINIDTSKFKCTNDTLKSQL